MRWKYAACVAWSRSHARAHTRIPTACAAPQSLRQDVATLQDGGPTHGAVDIFDSMRHRAC